MHSDCCHREGFNSTLVRFKSSFSARTLCPWTRFQFHIGSIQVDSYYQAKMMPLRFQFHIGSIQVLWIAGYTRKAESVSIPHWFDSSAKLQNISEGSILFQFHIGSIQVANAEKWRANANEVSIPHWFDSSSVICRPCRCHNLCFNSTLVRFKSASVMGEKPAVLKFQFHIGSIQVFGWRANLYLKRQVSIPHWFDSSQNLPEFSGFGCGVSIPHWFDSSRFQVWAFLPTRGHVSIPHWFDSSNLSPKVMARSMTVSIPHWFDSSHSSVASDRRAQPRFNSTLVRFKSLVTRSATTSATVSIPHWFDSSAARNDEIRRVFLITRN